MGIILGSNQQRRGLQGNGIHPNEHQPCHVRWGDGIESPSGLRFQHRCWDESTVDECDKKPLGFPESQWNAFDRQTGGQWRWVLDGINTGLTQWINNGLTHGCLEAQAHIAHRSRRSSVWSRRCSTTSGRFASPWENFVHFMGFKYRHMDDFKGGLAKKDWGLNKEI